MVSRSKAKQPLTVQTALPPFRRLRFFHSVVLQRYYYAGLWEQRPHLKMVQRGGRMGKTMRYLAVVLFGFLTLPFGFGHLTSTAESAPSQVGVIRVWKVGSPHTGALPETTFSPALQQEAEKLGYRIEVEPFKAEGFAAKFWRAVDQHDEPEVIAFDNYGVLVGIQTALGRFQGIGSDPRVSSSLVMVHESLASLQERGWVMLVA